MVDARAVWVQVLLVLLAFVLSSMIGYERQVRHKSAGLRTHTLVGVGAALFMLVSKWGFSDVVGPNVSIDPSRVAAQIVSGIGFIGGGLIFVRRDAVRGLTTASVVWITAAIGAAAGAGMVVLAVTVTAAHFVVIVGFTAMYGRFPQARGSVQLRIVYANGTGALRRTLVACTKQGFEVGQVTIEHGDVLSVETPGLTALENGHAREADEAEAAAVAYNGNGHSSDVTVALELYGTKPFADLAHGLTEVAGVRSVVLGAGSADD